MTIEEVVEWLGTINLSKYAEIFKENDVDGELLASCDVPTLEEMGIISKLDQRKIFVRFRKIK